MLHHAILPLPLPCLFGEVNEPSLWEDCWGRYLIRCIGAWAVLVHESICDRKNGLKDSVGVWIWSAMVQIGNKSKGIEGGNTGGRGGEVGEICREL